MFWHVVAFEGFSGHPSDRVRFSYSFVKNHWLPLLAHTFPGCSIRYYSQAARGVRAAVRDTQRVCQSATDTAVAVLGFSNGGHAAIQFAEQVAGSMIRIRLGFTADPIPKGWRYVARRGEVLTRPANVERWVNVYQRSDRCSLAFLAPLKGYPVLGAEANTELHGLGPRGHVHLPSDALVLAKLCHEFRAAGVPSRPSQEMGAAVG